MDIQNYLGEVWESPEGFRGLYRVSCYGRVVSYHSGEPMLLTPIKSGAGYRRVTLRVAGRGKPQILSRLVAKIFVPNPDNKPEVNHKDGDKTNNCASNLEWVTHRENQEHAARTGLMATGDESGPRRHIERIRRGSGHYKSKLTEDDIRKIRELVATGMPDIEVAKMYNISNRTVGKIKFRLSWKHVT